MEDEELYTTAKPAYENQAPNESKGEAYQRTSTSNVSRMSILLKSDPAKILVNNANVAHACFH